MISRVSIVNAMLVMMAPLVACGEWSQKDEPLRAHPGPCRAEVDDDADGSLDATIDYAYDEDDRQTRVEEMSVDGELRTLTTFEYDDAGRLLVEQTRSNVDPGLNRRRENTYDGAGRLTETVVSTPAEETRMTFLYDERGREIVRRLDEGNDGAFEWRTMLTYQGDRLTREKTIWLEREDVFTVTEYDYDEEERLVESVKRDADDVLVSRTLYSYYDDGVLRRFERDVDGDDVVEWTILYSENGDMLVDELDRLDDLGFADRRAYLYDDAGNRMVAEHDEGIDGHIDRRTRYFYGCWLP